MRDQTITNAIRRMRSNRVLNSKAIPWTRKLIERSNKNYNTSNGVDSNCWGLTAWLHGLADLDFIDDNRMLGLLAKNFRRVKDDALQIGDVLVIENSGYDEVADLDALMHTAVYIGAGMYFHQLGYGGAFRIDNINVILNVYRSDHWYHVRRSKYAKRKVK